MINQLILTLAALALTTASNSLDARSPNVVLIFTDDQGFSDVGVFGSERFGFSTPNLDRMAVEGMKFTDFYVAASVCSPSRAALLTGSYPPRAGITRVLFPNDDSGLNPDELTVADVLRKQGYATAAIGKWHLGHHPEFLPTRHGFDMYWGVPYSNDMWLDPRAPLAEDVILHDDVTREWIRKGTPNERRRKNDVPLMINEVVVEYPIDQATLTRRSTEEAIRFMKEKKDQPFFVYLPHVMPHIPLFASGSFEGKTERGLYGDVIEELDWSVGEILRAIRDLGLDEDTLVIFTTDNGPWNLPRGQGGHADPLRGYKFSVFEGGMRVPAIMRWPGRIPAGTIQSEVAATIDLLPTLAYLAGAELPDHPVIDGKNIWPLMAGEQGARSPHEAFYFYRTNRIAAIREGHWKYHAANDDDPEQLYNLAIDIGESNNLAPLYRAVCGRLHQKMKQFDADLKANARPKGRLGK